MSEFDSLLQGMSLIMTPGHIGLMVIGVLLGILVGVLPGLGAPNGVALLLPLTFTMSPVSAIILLSCMYWGALFGGSITSILFNIPGEPSSVATTFDGYPMAREGRAAEALTAAFSSASSYRSSILKRLSADASRLIPRICPARSLRKAWMTFDRPDRVQRGTRVQRCMSLAGTTSAFGCDAWI